MIRVTVELVPYGDESRAKTLHTAVIANDGTGTKNQGNYHFSLSRKGSMRPWKSGRIRGVSHACAWALGNCYSGR